MTPSEIIAAARACLDTPFVHQGRIPGLALDCAGLVVAVIKTLGVACQDVSGYGRSPAENLIQKTMDAQTCFYGVPTLERQPGDVLLMRFTNEPQHLAVYAGETLIHSYESVGKVCEHRLADVWAARIVRVYRFKDLASPEGISSPIAAQGVGA